MAPDDFHDFFVASAGVAGALIGLLFVALSVAQDRLVDRGDTQIHRVRASAALTCFTNALVVSLFALIPTDALGGSSTWVAIAGLLFVLGSMLALLRRRESRRLATIRDGVFLVGMALAFVAQLLAGVHLLRGADDSAVTTLATLVVVFFLVGVGRAWELVGGPSVGLRSELGRAIRHDDGQDVRRRGRDSDPSV